MLARLAITLYSICERYEGHRLEIEESSMQLRKRYAISLIENTALKTSARFDYISDIMSIDCFHKFNIDFVIFAIEACKPILLFFRHHSHSVCILRPIPA